jgi:hypothetical protein
MSDIVKDESVWKRISDLSVEYKKEGMRARGPNIAYVLSYESRVEDHQITIKAVKQVIEEGLLNPTKLFPRGGSHNSVGRDVEAFDRLLYAEWESGLEPMNNDRGKRVEFREFLEYRTRTWGEEYIRWLKTR